MGQRISYYKNNFDKGLKALIIENYSAFRQWYLNRAKSSLEEFNELYGNEIFLNYLQQTDGFHFDFDKLDKHLADELTAQFIANYLDTVDGDGNILEFFGPTFNKWRYDESTEMVLQTDDVEFIQLWNFLIKGRSLKDKAEFNNYSNEFKIGYLTFEEHRLLLAKIELHFGNPEQIKDNYLSEEKKLEDQKVIQNLKNRTYFIEGQNDNTLGLISVLQVLMQITPDKNELITKIE